MKGVNKRGINWILSRNKGLAEALKFASPETQAVVERILKYAEDKQKGLFKPNREKDELTLGLGNPEHTGRVRGLGKRMIWREG